MKKITLNYGKIFFLLLLCLLGTDVLAQSQFNPIITGGSTSGNGRAPQGSARFNRSHLLVTAAEMTAGGFASGDLISGIGFSYETAQNIPTTGTLKVYLENTADVTNTKSLTWSTAITGMTLASDAATTVPAAVGDYNIEFSNGTAFTYTGGNLYVGFDYQNPNNTLSTNNISLCSNALVNGATGIASVISTATTAPTTLTRSAFRPQLRLAIPVSCARPTNLGATNATATSVDLTWTPSSTGTGIELEYGLQGFTQGMGTMATGATVNSPYTVNGLSPNTVYDYYVRSVCSGSVSNWNGPFTFTSLFQPSAVPYSTSFENIEFPYFGWIAQRDPSGTIGNFWQTVNLGAGPPAAQDGSFVARVGAGVTAATGNDWIISRGVNLTAGATATIEFYVAIAQTGTTTGGSYNLTVGTAQNVAGQTTTIANAPTFVNTAYELKTHTYTVPATGVYYFGIQSAIPTNTAGSLSMVIDNFSVRQTLSVESVDELTVSVYPNPANDTIFISSTTNLFNNISIIDMNGRMVKSASFDNISTVSMDIAELSSGVYFLNINSNEGSVSKKLIKN